MRKYILILGLVLLVVVGVALAKYGNFRKDNMPNSVATSTPVDPSATSVACTMEAKQCPDGSYVGRQGPKCEFAACPTSAPIKKDCPLLAPVGPNFCPNGKVEGGGIDTKGCQLPPKCVVQSGEPTSPSGCTVGGCSGTLCTESGEDMASTCEYRDEYACYKQSTCERQSSGKCGWTQNDLFKACMAKYQN